MIDIDWLILVCKSLAWLGVSVFAGIILWGAVCLFLDWHDKRYQRRNLGV